MIVFHKKMIYWYFDIRQVLRSFFRLDTVFGRVGSMIRMVDKVEPVSMIY